MRCAAIPRAAAVSYNVFMGDALASFIEKKER